MECTSIKFELFWRKIIRKDGCKGVSETAHKIKYTLFYPKVIPASILSQTILPIFYQSAKK